MDQSPPLDPVIRWAVALGDRIVVLGVGLENCEPASFCRAGAECRVVSVSCIVIHTKSRFKIRDSVSKMKYQ